MDEKHEEQVERPSVDFNLRGKLIDFPECAKTAWFGPLDITGLDLIDNDLAIGGVRLDTASSEAYALVNGATCERHQAVNWLCGQDPVYSQVTADT